MKPERDIEDWEEAAHQIMGQESAAKAAESGARAKSGGKINGVEDAFETLFQNSEEMVGRINPVRGKMTV